MKNKLITLILTTFALTACGTNNSSASNVSTSEPATFDRTSLSIVTPTGAPALGFYNFATSNKFETNDVPTNIVPMMVAGQKDVIVLPTNAGVQAIVGKKAPYLLAATITFGNFYIASMGNDDNNVMDASDTILLFQKGNVPDKIFHYVYGDSLDAGIKYVEAVSDASKALIQGKYVDSESGENVVPNYVMIAEPALTAAKGQLKEDSKVSVYANLQEKYKEKSDNKELFQASVFVKNDASVKAKAADFLSTLKADIEGAVANPDLLKEGMKKVGDAESKTVFGVAPELAANVLILKSRKHPPQPCSGEPSKRFLQRPESRSAGGNQGPWFHQRRSPSSVQRLRLLPPSRRSTAYPGPGAEQTVSSCLYLFSQGVYSLTFFGCRHRAAQTLSIIQISAILASAKWRKSGFFPQFYMTLQIKVQT